MVDSSKELPKWGGFFAGGIANAVLRLRGAALPLLFSVPVLFSPGCSAAPETPEITVHASTLQEAPHRLGVNIGASAYWGDQQMVANPFAHGGFHKGRQTLLIQVKSAVGKEVRAAYYSEGDDAHRRITESFSGGEYCIATGPRAGEQGRILAHSPGSGVFTLEHEGPALKAEEVIWLRGPWVRRALPDPAQGETPLGIGDFRALADEAVALEFVDDAQEEKNQFLRITFPAGGGRLRGGFKHYIKATPITNYTVRIRARADFEGAEIGVGLKNHGIPHDEEGNTIPFFSKGGKALGPEWKEFVFRGGTYADPRIGDNFSAFSIVVNASGAGHAWIDWVRLEDDMIGHPSGFAKPVVDALKEARCGVLRFYGISGLGNLIEDVIAPTSTEGSWTFLSLASGFRFNTVHAPARAWLALCKEVGAQPWMTLGGANTPEDWVHMISYLAAPAGYDAYAKMRAEQGAEAPWTDAFDMIYLEIGNEWWNGIFRPFHIWPPEKYGELVTTIAQAIEAHPHFDAGKIQLVAGGWAINAHHWNGLVDAKAIGHARLSLAPYLVHELDRATTPSDRYGALFADVDAYLAGGGASTQKDLAQNGKDTGLAVYELNTHITGGGATAKAASEICTSTAAGVAVLDQAMSLMAHLGADPINYFTLLQRGYGHGEQQRLGLWGTLIRLPDGDLQARPVWHGLRLANHYLIEGALVESTAIKMPVWAHEENGSVPSMRDLPVLHHYAFLRKEDTGKRAVNLLVVNRDVALEHSFLVRLPFAAAPEVGVATLASALPKDNNEAYEKVALRESRLTAYDAAKPLTAPPCSAVVFQFTER